MTIRPLTSADGPPFDAFLAPLRDSSMFLRGNARRAGLDYLAQPFQAIYAGAFRDDRLAGVAAHYWNGMVVLQAPEHAGGLARACVDWSKRPVTGFAGPVAHVRDARTALGLDAAEAALDEDELMYGLELADLVVPAALSNGTIVCRAPRPDERDLLCEWRLAYDIELLGTTDSAETRTRSAEFLDTQIADQNAWVAVVDGVPVSLSAFNAALPDIVQLGGIYTPPPLRGRGYAKVGVAASLLVARERGASRAVLFTSNPNAARCYEAVGFRRTGNYSLVLFR